jgi:hypothetical protein
MRGTARGQIPGAKTSVCHGVGGMFAASGSAAQKSSAWVASHLIFIISVCFVENRRSRGHPPSVTCEDVSDNGPTVTFSEPSGCQVLLKGIDRAPHEPRPARPAARYDPE